MISQRKIKQKRRDTSVLMWVILLMMKAIAEATVQTLPKDKNHE